MDRFTLRQRQIITLIAACDSTISGKELSQNSDLSLRTIQSEVAAINRILPLIRSTNKGYSIDKEEFSSLNVSRNEEEKDEEKILYSLIFSDSPYFAEDLADDLFLSVSTLENRIRNISKELKEYQLSIKKENGYLYVEGDEYSKREFITHLMEKELSSSYSDLTYLENYFENTDIEHIRLIVVNSIDSHNCYIDQIYLNNVLVSIIIALYRMRDDHYIKRSSFNISKTSVEYQIAQDICSQYSDHWHIEPMEEDTQYIASLLVGQVRSLALADGINKADGVLSPEFIQTINSILSETFSKFMLDIDYSSQLNNFCLHVDAMLKRAKINRPAENLLLLNLKKNSPFIYDVSVYITEKISESFHTKIEESEIGFISVHIGYLIENSLQSDKKANLVLYCDEYHNISTKIQNTIYSRMAEYVRLDNLRFFDTEDPRVKAADIVLTTKTLEVFGKTVIKVSPFYDLQDQMKVISAIQNVIDQKNDRRMAELLKRFFSQALFFVNEALSDRDEVISFMGNKLIEKNIVDEKFIASCYKRENLSPTCFFDSFAIPHAMELDSKKTMCCVLINPEGIQWGEETVKLVVMIAALKEDLAEFMELYNGFIQLLDPSNVSQIVASKNYAEFETAIRSLIAQH